MVLVNETDLENVRGGQNIIKGIGRAVGNIALVAAFMGLCVVCGIITSDCGNTEKKPEKSPTPKIIYTTKTTCYYYNE